MLRLDRQGGEARRRALGALFAPRKPKSTWSAINKERVERLIADGTMTEAGLAAIERAKANGAWEQLDAATRSSSPTTSPPRSMNTRTRAAIGSVPAQRSQADPGMDQQRQA